MVVADEVQHRVHDGSAPRFSNHLRADDNVTELTRHSCRQRLPAVDRESERIRLLVDREMLALQVADLIGTDELQAELAILDSLRLQNLADQIRRSLEVEGRAGT